VAADARDPVHQYLIAALVGPRAPCRVRELHEFMRCAPEPHGGHRMHRVTLAAEARCRLPNILSLIVPAPPPLTNRFAPLIRIALGLIIGLGLAFLAHYLDPSLRVREDLEALGLPVIGVLPRE
jgi:hypothetical protein